MDWRVDFSVEPEGCFNIQFQQAEEVITVELDSESNEAPLTEIARAVIQVWYGAPEVHILWYDYRNRYPLYNSFVFEAVDNDVLFEI